MRFYHISPSELGRLSEADQLALAYHMPRLRAKEMWNEEMVMGAMQCNDSHKRMEHQVELAKQAFAGDDKSLAEAIEAVTREG